VTYYWVIMIAFQDLITERNVSRHIDFPVSLEDIVVEGIVPNSSRKIPLLQLLDDRSSFNISLLDYSNEV
jgi:hypothetical protein